MQSAFNLNPLWGWQAVSFWHGARLLYSIWTSKI